MKIYNLEYDSEYDAYRYGGKLFICAKALRKIFPKVGERMKLVLCNNKPGVRITIGNGILVVNLWWWRHREYIDFYLNFKSEMSFLPGTYYVRMV